MKIATLPLISVAFGLVACGGGDGGSTPTTTNPTTTAPSTAEGVYAGTVTGGTNASFEALVLENGDIWSIYGQNSGSTFYVYGFVQGNGTSNNGTFTAASVKDFSNSPTLSASLSGTYSSTAKTINATISYTSGLKSTIAGGPLTNTTYNYNSAPSLSSVTGLWNLTSLQGEGIALSVSSTGALTIVSAGGCRGNGTLSARASGKNVFNISLTFGAAPCLLPNQTVTGIAVAYPLTTGQTQLIAAVTDSAHTVGTAVFGIR